MSKSIKQESVDAMIRRQLADALERSAKEAGHPLVRESVTCEMGAGFTMLTAAIARVDVPTEKELTAGVNLLYAYVDYSAEERLKPGFYLIRIATSGYNFKAGTQVSFIDSHGKPVHSFQAKSKPLDKGKAPAAPSFDAFAFRPINEGEICGRKKCLKWKRTGFLEWEWGCTDVSSGAVVNCIG